MVGRRTARTIMMSIIFLFCWLFVDGLENLISNPSFEEPLKGTWSGNGLTMEPHTADKVHGAQSLLCKDRKKALSGISHSLPLLKQGRGYEFSAYIKLLIANPDKLFQSFKAIVMFKFNHTDNQTPDTKSTSEKAPSCKGLKGSERKECQAKRKLWKQENKHKKAELKKKKQEEKRRLREERRKKKLEEKKKKKEQRKKRKEQEKKRKQQQKERERKQTDKGKQTDKTSQRKKRNVHVTNDVALNSLPWQPNDVIDHMMDDISRSRRETARVSRQRRQQRRQRVQPPKTVLKRGRSLAPTDDQEIKPISGYETREGAYIIAWRAWVTPESGWIELKGSINAPMLTFSRCDLLIRGPDAGCDFLVDNVTLYEIPERTDWLAESRDMIDTYRKTDVEFRVNIPQNIPRADVDIQVRLKKHLFAFGSKVEDDLMRANKNEEFQTLFFSLFNWATLGSFKWRFDRGTLFSPDFSNALGALEVLRQNDVKVRAHSILWGVKKNIPEAVIATPAEQLPALLSFHTQYMMNITRGKVAHWDVQNELLHGHWYEETMKDPNISMKVFKEARTMDPFPKLYLNDFTAVTSGANTEELHDTALRFLQSNTPLQGIGIQGHVKEYVKPDPTMMWRRLDRLAETGLELFMTEFDLGWNDDAVRADWFEDALRAFFAHPSLGGVILWGFWKDRQRYKNKFMVHGQDFQFSEQGKRYYCLVKKEWTTNVTVNMTYRNGFSLRAFQGDYEVLVKRRGVAVQRETFSLGKQPTTVNIDVKDTIDQIEVKEERDYVPDCVSHRDRKSLGVVYTTTSDQSLSCVDRSASLASARFEHANVTITCPEGSIMVGCSSFHKLHSSEMWRGEKIRMKGGTAICTASVLPYARAGMQVSARCCQQAGLTCDYRQAGPSSAMDGAMAEAKCPLGYTVLGCSVFNQYSHINGVFPANNLTSCRAVNGLPSSYKPSALSGVISGAVCCKNRGLRCAAVTSRPSQPGDDYVTVTCHPHDVMTGCNVQALNGGTSGSYLSTDGSGQAVCTAYTAADSRPGRSGEVVAVAICCSGRS